MTNLEYWEHEPHPGDGPIRVELLSAIDYSDLSDYAEAWKDKLAACFCEHITDDECQSFVSIFREYASQADKDGPAFEEWRAS